MRSKVINILILLILLPLLCSCDSGSVDNSKFVEVKKEELTDPIQSLYIEWNSGVVNITKNTENKITIIEKAKEDFLESNMFTSEINNGQLKVSDPHYDHPVIMLEHDIDISVPDQLYSEININGTSTEIDLLDFKADKLLINTNTAEHHIEGDFQEVTSDFTSSEVDYKFLTLPKIINFKGYVSSGRMILPVNSGFTLNENLKDSELHNEFEMEKLSDTQSKTGNGKSEITISMEESEFSIEENK